MRPNSHAFSNGRCAHYSHRPFYSRSLFIHHQNEARNSTIELFLWLLHAYIRCSRIVLHSPRHTIHLEMNVREKKLKCLLCWPHSSLSFSLSSSLTNGNLNLSISMNRGLCVLFWIIFSLSQQSHNSCSFFFSYNTWNSWSFFYHDTFVLHGGIDIPNDENIQQNQFLASFFFEEIAITKNNMTNILIQEDH